VTGPAGCDRVSGRVRWEVISELPEGLSNPPGRARRHLNPVGCSPDAARPHASVCLRRSQPARAPAPSRPISAVAHMHAREVIEHAECADQPKNRSSYSILLSYAILAVPRRPRGRRRLSAAPTCTTGTGAPRAFAPSVPHREPPRDMKLRGLVRSAPSTHEPRRHKNLQEEEKATSARTGGAHRRRHLTAPGTLPILPSCPSFRSTPLARAAAVRA